MSWLSSIRSRLASSFSAARPVGSGAWLPMVVREPYTGAWQQNVEIRVDTALTNPSVFGCVTRIASDISKIAPLRLFARDDDDIWQETTNPAYSPVLRKPNRYQTDQQFAEQWILSKLLHGNTYVLKERDERTVVNGLYLLDPQRVQALVAPDGSVYYQLYASDLAGIPEDLVVPARDMIHDRWNCAFHPLQGISPLYAAGGAALAGNSIQQMTINFFSQGGRPSGLLIAPTDIAQETAERIKDRWRAVKPGEILVTGHGMKYEQVTSSASDSQVTEQLNLTEEAVATCFGMPISILNSSKQPPYANAEASQLQYRFQCLQPHFTSMAKCYDLGLELPSYLQTDWDYDELSWLDTATITKAAHDVLAAGIMSPNEARRKYFGLGPVKGGETPYLQQQYYPLGDERPMPVAAPPRPNPTEEQVAATVGALAES